MQRQLAFTAAAYLALAGAAAAARVPAPLVHCDAGQAVANPPLAATPRIVLGRLAMTPTQLRYVVKRTDVKRFRWWSKAPLAIRAGTSVTLTVPSAWRTRVGITYGDFPPDASAASLRFQTCPGRSWHIYPGGFFTTTPLCFPLDITVGSQRTRIQTGMGIRCPTTRAIRSSQP